MGRGPVIRFPIDPRMVPAAKVARRLGLTEAQFAEKVPELAAAGFPAPDPILGTYCLQSVDRWIDARHGLTSQGQAVSDPSILMERVRRRAWAG